MACGNSKWIGCFVGLWPLHCFVAHKAQTKVFAPVAFTLVICLQYLLRGSCDYHSFAMLKTKGCFFSQSFSLGLVIIALWSVLFVHCVVNNTLEGPHFLLYIQVFSTSGAILYWVMMKVVSSSILPEFIFCYMWLIWLYFIFLKLGKVVNLTVLCIFEVWSLWVAEINFLRYKYL